MSQVSGPTPIMPVRWTIIFREPAFLVALLVLLVCAAGLNTTVGVLKLHFRKQPVPLRMHAGATPTRIGDLQTPLLGLPSILGGWVQVTKDEPLNHDVEDALATRDYVFRDYVKASVVDKSPQDLLKLVEGKTLEQRHEWLQKVQRDHPQAVVKVGITYYTGKADTVAHVPERCYLAEGYTAAQTSIRRLPVRADGLDVRMITFESPESAARVHVGYFFQCNGRYTSNSFDVRASLQSLFVKYAYYSKVELLSFARDQEQAATSIHEFLKSALPEVEQMLPDWESYKHRR